MDIGGGMATPGRILWSPDGRLVALDVSSSLLPHLITLVNTEDATVRHRIRVPIPPELPGKYTGGVEPSQMSGMHMLLGWADGGRSLVSLLGIEPGHDLSYLPGYSPPIATSQPGEMIAPVPSSPPVTEAAIYCYVLDSETGELARSVRVYSSAVVPVIYSLSLSPDGETLAFGWFDASAQWSGGPGLVPLNLDVWDLRNGELKYSINTLRVYSGRSFYDVRDQYVVWSRDGDTLYVAAGETIKVIEAATGKIMYALPDVVPPTATPTAVPTWPPNAYRPPVVPGVVSTAQPVLPQVPFPDIFGRFFPQPAPGFPATATPDPSHYESLDGIELSLSGDRLAAYAGTRIRVWDLTKREPVMLTSIAGLPPHITGPVSGVVLADVMWATGDRLLVSFVRNMGGAVWLIDAETGVHLGELVPYAQEMAWSPGGNKVAFLINGRLDIWGSEEGAGSAETPTGRPAP
jgi:WD40 repeat protein